MSSVLRAIFARVEQFCPDNDDPITVNPHKTLDDLADQISRADTDLLRAQTNLIETKERAAREIAECTEAVANATSYRERAHAAFLQRCSEKFSIDIPLPVSADPAPPSHTEG